MTRTQQWALNERLPYNSEQDIPHLRAHPGDAIWHETEMRARHAEVLYNQVLLNSFFTTQLRWSNFKASKSMRLKAIARLISWDDT